MVHVHAGSQGMALEAIVEAIRRTTDFALKVNAAAGRKQITMIDVGGGLPVNFESEMYTPDIPAFSAMLRQRVPELYTGEFQAITEYGRWYLAKAGFIASRVEYTKVAGGRHIALQHAG
jgi:diaminopimelate decarboxylase